jgi:hypothetical protein
LNLIPFALVMLLLGGFFFRLGLLSKHGRNWVAKLVGWKCFGMC